MRITNKLNIHWCWWRLFRKDWYTGSRFKYPGNHQEEYKILWDFGVLTIALHK